jgi:branched-chain amino acid transport system substrate-binding protein
MMVLAGISACTQASNTTNTPTQNQPPIKIGASLPLTGDYGDDGKVVKQGYELWADAVNKRGGLLGRQVQLDLLNDNSDAKQVTIDYQKLISVDKVDLVLGSMGPDTTVAGLVASAHYNYAYIEGIGSTKLIFDTVAQNNLHNHFAVSLPVPKYMAGFSNYVLSLPVGMRPKTAAYMGADDPFAGQQLDYTKGQLSTNGVKTVLDATYPAETTDYTPYAQKIIQAKADIVVLGSTSTAECLSFIKYFKQQKYDPKAFIAANGPDQGSTFTKGIGGSQYAEGVFVPNGDWSPSLQSYQNSQLVSAYLAKFGGKAADISASAAEAYSVGQVLEQAVNSIHSIDNAKLIAALHSGSYQTVQGPAKFAADGTNNLSIPYLWQWQKGQFISVYPVSSAKANPEFPKPAVW